MSAKKQWLVFKDGAHLVDGGKICCGASLNASDGQRFGIRPVALKTCSKCVQAVAALAGKSK